MGGCILYELPRIGLGFLRLGGDADGFLPVEQGQITTLSG